MKPEISIFVFHIATLLGLILIKKWISFNVSSLREYGLNHPLEEVPPAFFIWKYVNKVVTLVIIMTPIPTPKKPLCLQKCVPERCAS